MMIEVDVTAMLARPYLASIIGGQATWIVEGTRPLAVVAQQWTAPRWLVSPELPATSLAKSGGAPDFEVLYWCQVDPERVFECLRTGAPLPDRHGR